MRRLITICSVILLVFGSSSQAYRPVIDLGTLGGNSSRALSINDSGQIVGITQNSSGSGHACLFDPTGGGANIDLGTISGRNLSGAYFINDNGQIVGNTWAIYPHACLFDSTGSGDNIDLGTLGGSISEASSINNNGKIVGYANTSSDGGTGESRACIFDSTGQGNNINLGGLGGIWSSAKFINNIGQIVGATDIDIQIVSDVACLFDPTGGGANINLGTLGGTESCAFSINDNGQIVGWAKNSSGYSHACIFDPTGGGVNRDLGILDGGIRSIAYSINDNGQIVGWVDNRAEWKHACIFDPTGGGNNIDLNTLIDPSCGWTLTYAYSINNNGWIVGCGTKTTDGYDHAYLLTPEPASVMLLGLGGLAMLRKRRK
jgi:probable HAF family extracellular repeat protein